MGGLALIFPGQASQCVGMGVALRAHHPLARDIFAQADRITGLPITRLCEEGPLDRLTATEVAQPAVVAHSLAALTWLRAEVGDSLDVTAVAGHSVGELASYVAADVLSVEDALRLVQVRAQAMAAACATVDGIMAAVLNLDEDAVRAACEQASQADGSVELANLNAPGQLVISGERQAVERAGARARTVGARRVLPLTVGGPFHSRYMRPVADHVERATGAVTFRSPRVPVVGNVEGREIEGVEALRGELGTQVYSAVRWIDVLRRLAQLGCDRFVEIGPGQVLAGLVKRTLPDARVASLGEPADLPQTLALLRT